MTPAVFTYIKHLCTNTHIPIYQTFFQVRKRVLLAEGNFMQEY